MTGGDNGINLPGRPAFGIQLSNDVTYFYVVFGFFVVSLVMLYVLVQSPFGRSLEGIRERELRMRVARVQYVAAQIHRLHHCRWIRRAGGGTVGARRTATSAPKIVVLTTSVDALLMVVLGGSGTLVGGAIGAGVRRIPARISQHARAVVAVCAGRGLRPDDPLSAGRIDGHSGAHSPVGCTVRQAGGEQRNRQPDKEQRFDERWSEDHGSQIVRKAEWRVVSRSAMSLLAMPGAVAEEMRIGFLAPMTGPFAQVGKDMVNGWEMYADEVKGDFAGATVKFILEDDQAKPPVGVLKAEKLTRQDKVHMMIGGVLASTGYALAPVSTREKTVYIAPVAAADDLTQRDADKYPYFVRTGWTQLAAAPIRSASGPASRDTSASWRSPPTMPSATRSSAGSRRRSRPAAARSSRRSGRRSGPIDFGPVHSDHQAGRGRDLHAHGRADVAAVPQAAGRRGQQEARDRRRHELRRVHAALHGRRGHRPRLGAAVQRRAGHAEERGLRDEISREVRQGAVLLLGDQLHDRPR